MRTFFREELETVATYWRIFRTDGTTLAFTSHDRALRFDGIVHRAAPGMVPSAIRLTDDLSLDSAEVDGALSHDAISERDLAAGRFDNAWVEIGAVDWETLESAQLFAGRLGNLEQGDESFSAQLRSLKAILERDLVPRSSPTCRATFCGPGCGLSAARFTRRVALAAINLDDNAVQFAGIVGEDHVDGEVRFLAGPQTGLRFGVVAASAQGLILDRPLDQTIQIGTMALVREGCAHTLSDCSNRFGNAINFRGEPFLPGNDLIARYPKPQ